MAKINPKANVETVEKTVKVDNTAILDRLDKLEAENRELKEAKQTSFQKAKEINKDPRKFSYKLWWGVPVLEYKSIRKDKTKDLNYKNQNWGYISNHYLEIVLSNNKIYEVEVNEFNSSFTRSNKIEAFDEKGNLIQLWDKPKDYTFKTTEHGTFTVEESMIN